jgi:uncharacterized protein YdaU (DUF1376 family)
MRLPWTRFSYDDFFDDPAVCGMGDRFIGPYLRLLHAAHGAKEPGYLPNDDAWLRQHSRLGPKAWEIFRPLAMKAFEITERYWIQKRVVREHLHARKISAAKSRAGKASAAKRSPTGVERVLNSRSTDLESRQRKRRILDSKTLESEPAFSQKAQVNGLVKDLSTRLNGKAT